MFSRGNKRLADAVKTKSSPLKKQRGCLTVYKVKLKDDKINVPGCRRFSFGKDFNKRNRTIMVLGETGVGKSTLINGMINYILGVEWKDSYRFKLVYEDQLKSQADSQTSEVTVYKINHQQGFKIDHSLTIVDTPGFGDTRGIKRDKEITEQLRNLFTDQRGVSEIDAICFIAKASLARLTPTQKYVFDSVLSIFGKDVAENIRVLVTFADGKVPPVLEAIKESGVPCPETEDGLAVHFEFNNLALFASAASSMMEEDEDESDSEENFDEMFWDMGTKSMKKFFVALNKMKTKSLTLTKEVLRERQRLENLVDNLQVKVKGGLAKLEEIKETKEKVKDHEAEISRNENFEIEVSVMNPVRLDLSGPGYYLNNCQKCIFICHYPSKAKTPVDALIAALKAEYDRVQVEVVRLMKSSTECLNRLKEIALKPDPLSTPEYIDLLIEGEKSEVKPGWKQRVQSLMTIRDKAETLAKVERGEKLLDCEESEVQDENQPPSTSSRGDQGSSCSMS